MNSTQTIFNKDYGTVTISPEEYNRLLEYKAICKDIYSMYKGGDGE